MDISNQDRPKHTHPPGNWDNTCPGCLAEVVIGIETEASTSNPVTVDFEAEEPTDG